MTAVLKILSYSGLALTVVPAVLVLAGVWSWRTHTVLMLVGAVLWFATSSFWMDRAGPS